MAETQQPVNALVVQGGDRQQEAIDLGQGVFMSRDAFNAYRMVTPAGNVIIDTGIKFHSEENFWRLTAVSDYPTS